MTARKKYVVLHHSAIAETHYDVLVEREHGGALQSWRAPVWPVSRQVVWTEIPDHRPLYLDFEGDLSGQRGTVRRIAAGTCAIEPCRGGWLIYLDESPTPLRLTPSAKPGQFTVTSADAAS